MNDINLLPEDLRGAEGKELSKRKSAALPAAFHMPDKEKEKESKISISVNGKRRWEMPDEDKAKKEVVEKPELPPLKMDEEKKDKVGASPEPEEKKVKAPKKKKAPWQARDRKGNGFLNWFLGVKEKPGTPATAAPLTDKPLIQGSNLPTKINLVEDIKSFSANGGTPPAKEPKITPPKLKKIKKPKPPKGEGFFSKLFKKKPKFEPKDRRIIHQEKIEDEIITQAPLPPLPVKPVTEVTTPPDIVEKEKSEEDLQGKKQKKTIFGRAIDVNLLPEGASFLSIPTLLIYLVLAAIVGFLAVGGIYFGLIVYSQNLESQFNELELKLSVVQNNIEEYKVKELEASVWSSKIEAINAVLERHIYWSKFFPELEKITIPDVYYKSITATNNGEVILSASAPDYTTVAKQWMVFRDRQTVFPDFEISGIAKAESEITFSVTLKLSPQLYYSLEEDIENNI